MSAGEAILREFAERGLLHDSTDAEALAERLSAGPITLYCGFDPTADSLHIGNLQSIMLLRRFQEAGHRPIALVGGATGMIGDPSGRDSERAFLDTEVLDRNRESIKTQLTRFLDFTAETNGALLVDNRDWTEAMSVLEFLRDVGKFVTVNTMLAKESVRSRIEREEGISFTEFSYMLLQANDFEVLHRLHGCELQVAGSDQWGNITAGVDLARRRSGVRLHGLTAPLITRADGSKFGKSQGENIWLAAERTSPFRLYQYFLNVADEDVEQLLLRLTLMPVEEIRSVVAEHLRAPQNRLGQRRLARELTALVHGASSIGPIEAASATLFGAPVADAGPEAFELLREELPTTSFTAAELEGRDLADVFVMTGLAKSKGELRRNAKGYYVNQESLEGWDLAQPAAMLRSLALHGRFVLLQRGRGSHHLVEFD